MKLNSSKLIVNQIDKITWQLIEGVGRGAAYSYLLEGTDSAVLIDTGYGLSNLRSACKKLCGKPTFVINTHGHLDHISKNGDFNLSFIHPSDIKVFDEHSSYSFRKKFIFDRMEKKNIPKSFFYLPIYGRKYRKQCVVRMSKEVGFLHDGMEFELGDRKLRIIHTPGHTMGSVCIYEKQTNRIYSGDMICSQGVLLNFEHSSTVEVYKRSLLELKYISNSNTRFFPGHQLSPIDHTWIDDFVECCDLILTLKDRNPDGTEFRGGLGRMIHKRAKIDY